ncbi:hypothetical protein [Pseudomonas aeruginosa]|jgi:hypothetical protein|uniref:hypothetical protein n=1 Tax=Pseudomonas aeruginosa TaxID=287 RepID=UPI0018694A00|nr:hypothetical protein [Pseudomonas aeruginosa]MBE2961924.1 hypothetical protein [Pseudomonas aeruginosa]MDU0701037.1 hypothetical protein [Pseudomonas aeruginosa]HDU8950430.1 hypothetical protein [Pseudomonas aeruginosa]
MNFGISEGIALLSLFVSVVAAVFAKNSSSAANKISKDNLNLQYGMVELEMRQAIENAKAKVNDIAIIMAPLLSKKGGGTIDAEGEFTLESYRKNFDAAVETLLNTYDDACSKYLDGKVDRERFKKNYKFEIRNLLEKEDLKEYFSPLTSRYKPIINVYTEWESVE